MTNPKQPTARQMKFFELKCQGYTNVKAAIEAGYSKKCPRRVADEIVKYKWYQDLMKKHVGKIEKRVQITVEEIVKDFIELKNRCMQKTPVMVFDKEIKDMVQVTDEKTGEGVWKFDAMGANKALESLGKHLGMFVEKVEHSGQLSTIQIVTSGNATGLLKQ
ncbi:MAG: terminase small subunit [Smithella sp.]|jgi:phage terminase small subunit